MSQNSLIRGVIIGFSLQYLCVNRLNSDRQQRQPFEPLGVKIRVKQTNFDLELYFLVVMYYWYFYIICAGTL